MAATSLVDPGVSWNGAKVLHAASKVDQSGFKNLGLFDSLAGRNAQAVYAEMKFE